MGRGWVCLGLALWLAACGGRSERNEGSDDDGAAAPDGDDQETQRGDDDVPGDDVALPGCKLGPRDVGRDGQDCLWLADQRCYSDKLEACGCICPRDHESICSSGFASEYGRTPVYCY